MLLYECVVYVLALNIRGTTQQVVKYDCVTYGCLKHLLETLILNTSQCHYQVLVQKWPCR